MITKLKEENQKKNNINDICIRQSGNCMQLTTFNISNFCDIDI